NPLYDAPNADDIIYGGLGDDFLHGGAGGDPISGAQALPLSFFEQFAAYTTPGLNPTGTIVRSRSAAPRNPGKVLGFGARRDGKFAAYDEFNALRRIEYAGKCQFIGNFNAADIGAPQVGILANGAPVYSDGGDRIFGDLGNDYLVGGTGRDHIFGG